MCPKDFLLRDNNGIPSLRTVHAVGKRSQDKKRLQEQLRIEKAKAASLKSGVLTSGMIKVEAKREVMSNDKIMRLDKEQLQLRIKIAQMPTKTFWEELVVPGNKQPHRFITRAAWKSFPRMHQTVHREKDARSVQTKTKVVTVIGSYLR